MTAERQYAVEVFDHEGTPIVTIGDRHCAFTHEKATEIRNKYVARGFLCMITEADMID